MYEALGSADLKFEPGTAQSYSNAGYDLVAMLIEVVSGQSYRAFLKEHIFDPLEMDSTQLVDPKNIMPPRLSVGHMWQAKNKRNQTMPPAFVLSGAIISTIIDMAKWDAALYTENLVSKASLKQIWTPYTSTGQKPVTLDYGFGWNIKKESGKFHVRHNGTINGTSAYFIRHINRKLTLIVFTNGGHFDRAEEIARATARYYFQHIQAAG